MFQDDFWYQGVDEVNNDYPSIQDKGFGQVEKKPHLINKKRK